MVQHVQARAIIYDKHVFVPYSGHDKIDQDKIDDHPNGKSHDSFDQVVPHRRLINLEVLVNNTLWVLHFIVNDQGTLKQVLLLILFQ